MYPAERTSDDVDEVGIAPAFVRGPAANATEPPTVTAPLRIAPLEEAPLLRNGLEGTEHQIGVGDGSQSVSRSTLGLPRFQPDQLDSTERLDVRDEPDEPAQSMMAPVAAALIVGLALGLAGGYALGGRRGTPAAASEPPATVLSKSTKASTAPGREFTEAAVGEANSGQPTPAPGASPSTSLPTRGQARSGAATARDGTSDNETPRAAAASVTAPGRLLVRSTPPGARVFVDGREHGETPATIRDLPRGTHRVRITRDGYAAEERRIAISTAQPSQSITVELKRVAPVAARSTGSPAAPIGAAVGALTVESRPDGARVFLDGRLVGTTPLSLPQISGGEHAVRLEREGYRPWSSSVRVAGGQRQRVAASLER